MPQVVAKRSGASLIGGIVIAVGIFALLLLLMGNPGPLGIAIAALVSLGVGAWVRLADL
jgi:hypothetical protein